MLSEIKHSVNRLIEVTRNYDIKKVLPDSSKTVISVGDEESRKITIHLASGLITTRVEKLARVQSLSPEVEATAKNNISYINQVLPLSFAQFYY